MAKAMGGSREPAREERRLARKERRHAERRRAIMDAARKLLVSEGIENFTVSAVAAVAEVSKPAVYYYFDSKEELVGALAVEALRAETEAIRRAIEAADDGVGALVGAVRAHVKHYLADLDRFRILYVWTQLLGIWDRLAETEVQGARAELDEALARKLQAEQARGRLRADADPRKLVSVAHATAHGLVCAASCPRSAAAPEPSSILQLCDEACRVLRRAVANE